jgi:hypothetical protein
LIEIFQAEGGPIVRITDVGDDVHTVLRADIQCVGSGHRAGEARIYFFDGSIADVHGSVFDTIEKLWGFCSGADIGN